MIPHDPDANVTMPWPSYAGDFGIENQINARLRHCRVRVKRWKNVVVPSVFTPIFPPLRDWWELPCPPTITTGGACDPHHPFKAIA